MALTIRFRKAKSRMINLLYIVGIWGNGGIEKVVYTYCKNLPSDKYKITILPIEKQDSVFTKKIEQLGIEIIEPYKKVCGNAYAKYLMRKEIVCKSVTDNRYDIVHFHNSISTAYLFIKAMKKVSPTTKYILHSHGDDAEAPHVKIKRLMNSIIKTVYEHIPDFCTGCSDNAGKWLFTKKVFNSSKYTTLFNAFNTKEYAFDKSKRDRMKFLLNVKTSNVIGTIGRFCYQKNPEFILEIIKELDKRKNDFTFVWIGDGPDKASIQVKAREIGVDKRIIYVSATDDIPGYLSMLDVFILPSRYEGLVLVLVEALASGLKCYASDAITRDTQVTDKIEYLPIDSSQLWATKIIEYLRDNKIDLENRTYPEDELKNSEFDVEPLSEKLNQIYKRLYEGNC